MLMAAMGPMGIAIGAAIDEGIAKEIAEAAEQGDSVAAERVDAFLHRPSIEFYDLSSDRAEQHDLSTKQPEKVKELEAEWQAMTDGFLAGAAGE